MFQQGSSTPHNGTLIRYELWAAQSVFAVLYGLHSAVVWRSRSLRIADPVQQGFNHITLMLHVITYGPVRDCACLLECYLWCYFGELMHVKGSRVSHWDATSMHVTCVLVAEQYLSLL
jgi:hypothetical protein